MKGTQAEMLAAGFTPQGLGGHYTMVLAGGAFERQPLPCLRVARRLRRSSMLALWTARWYFAVLDARPRSYRCPGANYQG